MSNTNTNFQTQTSNALHNAIMEAVGKNRPPMLAPGNYVQWKSKIKRYIDTKPNNEPIYFCLQNPPYKFKWTEKTDPVVEGSSETTIEGYMENYKNIILVNVIPPDHVDEVPVVEPNQHDDVPVVPEHVLMDEDEDLEEEEFEEEEEPQEEEDDIEVDIKEDENEPELTYPYEEVDPLNPPPPASESEPKDVIKVGNTIESEDETVPASDREIGESSTPPFLREDNDGLLSGLMRRYINSLFGRMTSLSRRLCGRETAHALVKKKGKEKDKYYGKLILDLGNEVRSSVEQGTAAMENLVEKLGNAEDKAECKKLKKELEEARFSNTFLRMQNERVKRDLYWTRVRAHDFYQVMIHREFVFEERPNETIEVPVKDKECATKESRGKTSHVLEDTKFLVSGIATTASTQHEWYSRFDKHIVVASDDGRDDVYKMYMRYWQFHDHGYDLGGDILGIVVDFPNMLGFTDACSYHILKLWLTFKITCSYLNGVDEDLSKSSKGEVFTSCISTRRPLLDDYKKGKKTTVNDLQLIMCGDMFKKILSQGEALKIVSYMEIFLIMPPKSAPLTQTAIHRMIKESVDAAIVVERARHANAGNDARGSGPVRGQDAAPAVRECTFAGIMKCNPTAFHGTKGAVELRRWFEKTESVFGISECAKGKKVKFAAATLPGPALTWWNANVATIGLETMNQMPWTEMKLFMTVEFFPIEEVQRMEHELWNLKVKEYNIVAYTQRVNELALMCLRMVEPERVRVDAYIQELTDNIKGEVTSSKPANLNESMRMDHKLMEQKSQARDERILDGDNSRQTLQNNQKQGNARAMITAPTDGKVSSGSLPLCERCFTHHGGLCTIKCHKCGKVGHKVRKVKQEEVREVLGRAYDIKDVELKGLNVVTSVVRFGKKGKLAPRFVGPFEITEKVGLVAYQLDLPEELNGVHDTFHVSNLKKCLDDPTLQVPLDEIQVDAKLNFVEEPVEILKREFKILSEVELPSSRFGGIRNVDLNSRGNVRIR
ncbi:putative reverse transcriptase domain-containing protein [Tanacetum coccineum]|uniref:Reverse transcriptase domain-containing protein n=1 Tax=Tanacetum coccineum TaxID=301880 RepID=A0ABQ5BAQ5_9ASTR